MKCVFFHANLTILLFLIFCNQSIAQTWENNFFFRNITTDDGLSNPTVNCIYQDSRDFIWIGTVDGLNRYDGYEFKIYQSNPSNSNSLPSNRINALYEDSNHNLWIATSEGLCQFNFRTEKFRTFKSIDGFNQVYEITHDIKNNRVWMLTSNNGLSYLDLETEVVETFNSDFLKNSGVYKILIIDQELFIGTRNSGLYSLDLESFTVEEFCNTKNGRFQISNNSIQSLHSYKNDLFIGTVNGLIKYSLNEEKPIYYNPQTSLLPAASIISIAHDSYDGIYLATDNGLAILNNETGLFTSYQKKGGTPSTLSSNILRTVFVDKRDNLWLGSVQKGIDYVNRKSRSMTLVVKEYENKNTLSGNNMTCFAQDDKGGLWIGTKETGLNYYSDGQYRHFNPDETKYRFNDNNATDICIDDKGIVWISVYNGGLYAFRNGIFEHFVSDESNPNALQSNKVRDVEVGINNNLWLATENGLESFDIENGIFSHHYLENQDNVGNKRKNIRCILLDSEGKVYAGTNTGLYIYDPLDGKVDHFQANPIDSNALGHNTIVELFEDSNRRIWIGSRGGLINYNRKNKTFKNYTEKDDLPYKSIKSIEEDEQGNLWMATNNGIVRFSPDSEQVATFGKPYGLQHNMFNIKASTKFKDGRLIFGGPYGFNVFNPNELEPEKNETGVIFTELKLFDKTVRVSDGDNILQDNISLVERLKLSYRQSKHFSLYFSAVQFSSPDQVQYAYMLEGFDDKWNFIGNERHVSFTNLVPDDYVLNVMASDNGKWKNPVKQLDIIILPPIYMTLWFRLSIAMLIVASIVALYLYRGYHFRKRQKLLEKLVAEQNKEIGAQNEELQAINEELISQNESVVEHKDFIDRQNVELKNVQNELEMANLTLEEKILIRTSELEASNKKLDKTVKELDRFVYSASHDLSAPLKSILGLVNIAKLDDKTGNLKVHLDYIEDSILKQEKVIKNLIQYSRNARQSVKQESINLLELVNQIILELRYIPNSDRINIINNLTGAEIIRSDEQRMKMIITNILSNSIKYQQIKMEDSFVKIEFEKNAKIWRLVVKDNGQGIAEDQQKKIFDMFHRASEDSEGSGLGLFIVKEAVERLGGAISVKSSIKKGSAFELSFPNSK